MVGGQETEKGSAVFGEAFLHLILTFLSDDFSMKERTAFK